MTDTPRTSAIVKHERHADLPPPKSEVGVYGWVYHNLLYPWYNAVLTAIGVMISAWAIWSVLDFVVFGAVWTGEGREACQSESGALIHACWVFVQARFDQFMYGFYPVAERWRIDYSFLLLALASAPLFLRGDWIRRGVGLAVAAAATLLTLSYGVGPAILTAFMMFAPYALAYNRLGAILPRSDDNALIGFVIRLGVILMGGLLGYLAGGLLGYLLGSAVGGTEEASPVGWIAAFLTFGLVSLNRASVKAWIAFLLIFVYPFAAFYLWVGTAFGLEYVETSLWGGLFLTLVVAGTGIAVSLPIGILSALGRRSHMPAVRAVSVAFIEFWRGVPLITVL
ncbi:MAG TPA: amino acid ABC transporter permease, partial [Halothiobacillaceae bacterium]|nr:amino acid ABC transporter permease [Halothiobacillaceae bacterium]